MELCITDEKMHLTLALVCKKWKSFTNEKFIERVHLQWLDQEYHANTKQRKILTTFFNRTMLSLPATL